MSSSPRCAINSKTTTTETPRQAIDQRPWHGRRRCNDASSRTLLALSIGVTSQQLGFALPTKGERGATRLNFGACCHSE
jgi:hypothetical protein